MGTCREPLRPSVTQAAMVQFETLEELVKNGFGSCCLLNTSPPERGRLHRIKAEG